MSTIKTIDGAKHAGPSARDLTDYQWRLAKRVGAAASGDTAKTESENTIDVAGAGEVAAGVIENPGNAAGKTTTILTAGRMKVKLGYAGVGGDAIKAGANGVAVKAAAGEKAYGRLYEGGPAGAIVAFEWEVFTA